MSFPRPGLVNQYSSRPSDISHRSRTAWESIPGHLRYTPQTWNDNLPLGVSIMLIVTYLAYHYNEFLIQRLLIQQNPFANEALLNVSSIILSAVLVLGTQREHMSAAYRDFIETVRIPNVPHKNPTNRRVDSAIWIPNSMCLNKCTPSPNSL